MDRYVIGEPAKTEAPPNLMVGANSDGLLRDDEVKVVQTRIYPIFTHPGILAGKFLLY